MQWKDLKFEPHQHVVGGVRCRVEFENGEWCSIVGGPFDKVNGYWALYGDGISSFEIYSSSTYPEVKGWLSKAQVIRHLNYLTKKNDPSPVKNQLGGA